MVDFEDGQLVKGPYVVIDGEEYPVIMPKYKGNTPISSENLNKLQTDIIKSYKEELTKALNDLLKFQEFEKDVTIDSNEYKSVTMGALEIPADYIFLGCIAVNNGYADQFIVSYSNYGSNIVAIVHNRYVVQLSNKLKCKAIFIKKEYYNKVNE